MLTVTTGVTRTAGFMNCIGAAYLVASPYTAIPVRITAASYTQLMFNVGTAPTASTAYELVYSGCFGN